MKLVKHVGDDNVFLVRGSDVSQVTDTGMVAVLANITGQDLNHLPQADGKTLAFIQAPPITATVDVNALATALAPLLPPAVDPATVAHLVLVGLRAALPAS